MFKSIHSVRDVKPSKIKMCKRLLSWTSLIISENSLLWDKYKYLWIVFILYRWENLITDKELI